MKKILFFLIIFTISNSLTAQNEELNLFKNILLKGDSISKVENEIKYHEQIDSVNKLIQTIENEKLSLEEVWKKERVKYMELYQGK